LSPLKKSLLFRGSVEEARSVEQALEKAGIELDVTRVDALPAPGKAAHEIEDEDGLLGAVADYFFRIDRAFHVLDWSSELVAVTGRDPSKVLGRDLSALFPAFHGSRLEGLYRKAFETGEPQTTGISLDTTRGRRSFEIQAYPEADRLTVMGWDVTDQRAAEEAMELTETRYRLLADNVSDVIWTADARLRLTYVSPSVHRVLGYPVREALSLTLEDVLPAGSLARVREAVSGMEEAVRKGTRDPRQPWTEELEAIHRDGSRVSTETTAVVLRDPTGKFREVLGVTRDVTERKRMQARLREGEKLEAVGKLAGGVAHDFNNMLTAILGRTRRLLKRPEDAARVRAEGEEILKAAELAASTTRQLLAFSRKQVLHPSNVDVGNLVKELGEMLDRLTEDSVTLRLDLQPATGRCFVDAAQLEQSLVNLVLNAREAMEDAGEMEIATRPFLLEEGEEPPHGEMPPGAYVEISVSDTGRGMDPEILDHIFEPFYTTKPPGKGTGLGLSTVYGFVRQSGGYLSVESVPGEGTRFHVYLPQMEAETETADREEEEEGPRGRGETILLVEDEDLVRKLAAEELRDSGYRVQECPTAEAALRFLESADHPPDLLLTDVMLPSMDGRSLWETLRERWSGLKALFISGHTEKHIVRDGMLEPGTPFLPKPFTTDQMLEKVREVLEEGGGCV